MKNRFEELRARAAAPVEIVTAPLLYPTPEHIAEQAAQLLEASQFHTILEPSAGTGALIDAITYGNKYGHNITAVEESWSLVKILRSRYPELRVHHMDFLNFTYSDKFDRILMNPPFNGGADIKHIEHALKWLKTAIENIKGRELSNKVVTVVLESLENKGWAAKKKEEVFKMAEANKAFAHYRW